MTSNDTNTFDMSKLELLLREHFARTDKQLSDMRRDNSEFRTQMNKDFADFTTQINKDFSDFKTQTNKEFSEGKETIGSKIDGIHSEILHINERINGIEHDIASLFHWDYWLLSIILAIIALPHISEIIKSLFDAIGKAISGIIFLYRNKENTSHHDN